MQSGGGELVLYCVALVSFSVKKCVPLPALVEIELNELHDFAHL